MGLNYVHEASHSLYIKHAYNGAVVDTFLEGGLFGTNITIPVEERVENVVKRV
jgi:shikimate 5-dehydrogenase